MGSGRTFTSLSQTLLTLAGRYGFHAKLVEHRLRRDWDSIVGDQIARHTRPDAIRYRRLVLIADHSVWVQHLTFLKPTLIEKVNAAAGGPVIQDVVLRVGEVPAGDTAPLAPAPAATAPPGAETEADTGPVPISDSELRAHWTSVMARALQRRPASRPTKPGP